MASVENNEKQRGLNVQNNGGSNRLNEHEAEELAALLEAEDRERQAGDALILYCCASWLNFTTVPHSDWLSSTAVYALGRDLRQQQSLSGPSTNGSHSLASLQFRASFLRDPEPGNVLRYADVQAAHCCEMNAARVQRFTGAWQRQIPQFPCPVRCDEAGRVWKRIDPRYHGNDEWEEDVHFRPEHCWLSVEYDAMERTEWHKHSERWHKNGYPTLDGFEPAIAAVVFGALENGKHTCRPCN